MNTTTAHTADTVRALSDEQVLGLARLAWMPAHMRDQLAAFPTIPTAARDAVLAEADVIAANADLAEAELTIRRRNVPAFRGYVS